MLVPSSTPFPPTGCGRGHYIREKSPPWHSVFTRRPFRLFSMFLPFLLFFLCFSFGTALPMDKEDIDPLQRSPDTLPGFKYDYSLGHGGIYKYYYSAPTHSKTEERTASGEVKGEYSFVAPEGDEFEFKYSAGKQGYQVESNALPVPPEDTEEVRKAKEEFFAAYEKALELSEDEEESDEDDSDDDDSSSEEDDDDYDDDYSSEEDDEEDDEDEDEDKENDGNKKDDGEENGVKVDKVEIKKEKPIKMEFKKVEIKKELPKTVETKKSSQVSIPHYPTRIKRPIYPNYPHSGGYKRYPQKSFFR